MIKYLNKNSTSYFCSTSYADNTAILEVAKEIGLGRKRICVKYLNSTTSYGLNTDSTASGYSPKIYINDSICHFAQVDYYSKTASRIAIVPYIDEIEYSTETYSSILKISHTFTRTTYYSTRTSTISFKSNNAYFLYSIGASLTSLTLLPAVCSITTQFGAGLSSTIATSRTTKDSINYTKLTKCNLNMLTGVEILTCTRLSNSNTRTATEVSSISDSPVYFYIKYSGSSNGYSNISDIYSSIELYTSSSSYSKTSVSFYITNEAEYHITCQRVNSVNIINTSKATFSSTVYMPLFSILNLQYTEKTTTTQVIRTSYNYEYTVNLISSKIENVEALSSTLESYYTTCKSGNFGGTNSSSSSGTSTVSSSIITSESIDYVSSYTTDNFIPYLIKSYTQFIGYSSLYSSLTNVTYVDGKSYIIDSTSSSNADSTITLVDSSSENSNTVYSTIKYEEIKGKTSATIKYMNFTKTKNVRADIYNTIDWGTFANNYYIQGIQYSVFENTSYNYNTDEINTYDGGEKEYNNTIMENLLTVVTSSSLTSRALYGYTSRSTYSKTEINTISKLSEFSHVMFTRSLNSNNSIVSTFTDVDTTVYISYYISNIIYNITTVSNVYTNNINI